MTGKEDVLMYKAGEHHVREERTVETHQAPSSDMKVELQDSLVIPLSSRIIIMKYGKHQKNEAV